MSYQAWLSNLTTGDDLIVCAGTNYMPAQVTRATKTTVHVRKLKFRRTNGSMIRDVGSAMSARGASVFRIVRTQEELR
jgi:hypothetical protein